MHYNIIPLTSIRAVIMVMKELGSLAGIKMNIVSVSELNFEYGGKIYI